MGNLWSLCLAFGIVCEVRVLVGAAFVLLKSLLLLHFSDLRHNTQMYQLIIGQLVESKLSLPVQTLSCLLISLSESLSFLLCSLIFDLPNISFYLVRLQQSDI